MKFRVALLAVILTTALFTGCSGKTSSGKVLVDINGNKITEGDLDFLGEVNPRLKAQVSNPAGRNRILENLVEQELLYQEAVKEGINRDPVVKAKVDLYRRVIIAQSLIEKEIETAAKKYYDEHPDEFKKLQFSEIMVKYASPKDIKKANKSKRKRKTKLHSEKQALKIIKELKAKIDKGESFEEVAKKSSEDIATKSRGGDVGLVSKNNQKLERRGLGPLVEKAFTMKVGEISGPIKTPKGYYLIKLTRGIEPETFDEAKQGIVMKIRGDAKNDLVAKLKKDATIVYPEKEKAKEKMKEKAKKKKKDAAKKEKDGKGKDMKDGKGKNKKDGKGKGKNKESKKVKPTEKKK